MVVTIFEHEFKTDLCKKACKLRTLGNDFLNIYVNEDRTKNQRIIDKALRDERNKRNNAFELQTCPANTNESTRRLGNDADNGKMYYWAIRHDALKKIFIEQ